MHMEQRVITDHHGADLKRAKKMGGNRRSWDHICLGRLGVLRTVQ